MHLQGSPTTKKLRTCPLVPASPAASAATPSDALQVSALTSSLPISSTSYSLPFTPISKRLFIRDRASHYNFLIDTGSDVSVISRNALSISPISSDEQPWLYAANGSHIKTFGKRALSLDLGLRRRFNFTFFVAETQSSIIGADFLAHFHLCPDLHAQRLIDGTTQLSQKLSLRNCDQQSLSAINNSSLDPRIQELLKVKPQSGAASQSSVEHHILTTEGPPIFCRPRRLVGERLAAAKQYIQQMISDGVCRPSDSPWASPLHLVKKKDGSWRPCGDYRPLNLRTIPDRYPMRNVADFVNDLNGCTIFSKVDLKSAFWQIPMAKDSIAKTAVTTPFGLFEFTKMPFGLMNASQTFQRFADTLFRGLPFVYNYIDDLLVASTSEEEHHHHLKQLFQVLADNKLIINAEKSSFFQQTVNFLGHVVTPSGLRVDPDKVSAISNYPTPTSKRAVKGFIGLINHYRRFLPGIGRTLAPLHQLEQENFVWQPVHEAAFQSAKQSLVNACTLHYPTATGSFILTCDASDVASGASLEQLDGSTRRPIAFMSRKFPPAEKSLSAFDKELSAITSAIKHFQHFIEGRSLEIYTDHKPLVTAFLKREHQSPRQSRAFSLIAEYVNKLQHISGVDNNVADALSRAEAITASPFTITQLRDEQKKDTEVQAVQGLRSFTLVEMHPGVRIVCKVDPSNTVRPLVPSTLRRQVFDAYHQLSHPGQKAMRTLISKRYYWSKLVADVDEWVKTCSECQQAKIVRHTVIPPKPIDVPQRRFSHIHIDIVGPLKPSNGFKYLLTVVDRFTRWPEVIPIENIEASTVAEKFIETWIPRFGVPDIISSDRGLQFQSQLFANLTRSLGIHHIQTAAYNPRANGLVERFHRQLKDSLRATSSDTNWYHDLPLVLLSIRSVIKSDIGHSPAQLVYGDNLRLPADIIPPAEDHASIAEHVKALKDKLSKQKPSPTRVETRQPAQVPKDLFTADYVYVRKDSTNTPLGLLRTGPFKVLSRTADNVEIETQHGPDTVAWHRTTPAHLGKQVRFNIPRKRGRPRKASPQ